MKKFNNSNILAIIIFAVGLIATVVFAGILTNNTDTARDSVSGSETQIAELTEKYSDMAAYDGTSVNGDKVVEMIKELTADGIKANVVTKQATESYTAAYPTTTAKTDGKYINPDGLFRVSLTHNSNGILTDVTFKQQ